MNSTVGGSNSSAQCCTASFVLAVSVTTAPLPQRGGDLAEDVAHGLHRGGKHHDIRVAHGLFQRGGGAVDGQAAAGLGGGALIGVETHHGERAEGRGFLVGGAQAHAERGADHAQADDCDCDHLLRLHARKEQQLADHQDQYQQQQAHPGEDAQRGKRGDQRHQRARLVGLAPHAP